MTKAINRVSEYLTELRITLDGFPIHDVVQLGSVLFERRHSSSLFIAGNGGSAATASHMATDLGVGSLQRNNPLRVLSLCDNNAVLTAISNDIGYEDVFATQISLLAKPEDVLICFSASGNSLNILKAITVAKAMGVYTVAITGFNGGLARSQADLSIHTETKVGSYGVVEDIHSTISHILTEVIRDSVG